jgi:glycosidase
LEKYGIDGWRLDVASEVDDRFWREFRQTALEINPQALIIGEVWESANHWLDGSLFHSSMNYDFRKHCRDFFANRCIDAEEFEGRITHMLMRYRKNVVFAQLNLLDSHDVGRFLSLCQGDEERFKQAVLFQMCFVGIPSIFYGDEQGISGVLEDEYRHEMIWDGDRSIYDFYQKAVRLRREHPALRRGDFKMLYGKGDCISFSRTWEGERINVTLCRDGIKIMGTVTEANKGSTNTVDAIEERGTVRTDKMSAAIRVCTKCTDIDCVAIRIGCGEVIWEGESFRITGEKVYADD